MYCNKKCTFGSFGLFDLFTPGIYKYQDCGFGVISNHDRPFSLITNSSNDKVFSCKPQAVCVKRKPKSVIQYTPTAFTASTRIDLLSPYIPNFSFIDPTEITKVRAPVTFNTLKVFIADAAEVNGYLQASLYKLEEPALLGDRNLYFNSTRQISSATVFIKLGQKGFVTVPQNGVTLDPKYKYFLGLLFKPMGECNIGPLAILATNSYEILPNMADYVFGGNPGLKSLPKTVEPDMTYGFVPYFSLYTV